MAPVDRRQLGDLVFPSRRLYGTPVVALSLNFHLIVSRNELANGAAAACLYN